MKIPPSNPLTYVVYVNSIFQASSIYALCAIFDGTESLLSDPVELRSASTEENESQGSPNGTGSLTDSQDASSTKACAVVIILHLSTYHHIIMYHLK